MLKRHLTRTAGLAGVNTRQATPSVFSLAPKVACNNWLVFSRMTPTHRFSCTYSKSSAVCGGFSLYRVVAQLAESVTGVTGGATDGGVAG